jgi:protein lysine acetyltransferase
MDAVSEQDLADLELFRGASGLEDVASLLTPVAAERDQVLLSQGETAQSFLLLASGRVAVTRIAEDGGRHDFAELGAGTIVGELALLRGAPRVASVTATEDVTGFSGGAAALAAMLEVPEVAARLTRLARQRVAAHVSPVPVSLRDGSSLSLRPVLPADGRRASTATRVFSSRTLHQRFLGGTPASTTLIKYLTEVDYLDHFVWVALDDASGLVVADGRFVRQRHDRESAEVAFMVGDAFQGQGLGTLLLGALCVAARETGVARFSASTSGTNTAAQRLLQRYDAVWVPEDPSSLDADGPDVLVTSFDVPKAEDVLEPDLQLALTSSVRQVLHLAG